MFKMFALAVCIGGSILFGLCGIVIIWDYQTQKYDDDDEAISIRTLMFWGAMLSAIGLKSFEFLTD